MMDFIDRDNVETKKCYDYRYGMKQKSFKQGFSAGKLDRKDKHLEKKAKCPFKIPSSVQLILKKRARWIEGYNQGWQAAGKKKKK